MASHPAWRLLLLAGVLAAADPVVAGDRPDREPTEEQLTRRYGKPSDRDELWEVEPAARDLDGDGLSNRDDWDDDGDGLLDEDEQ